MEDQEEKERPPMTMYGVIFNVYTHHIINYVMSMLTCIQCIHTFVFLVMMGYASMYIFA